MSRIYLAVGRNNGNILNDYTVFLLQRLTKVEENLINTQKRVEEIIISEYG